MDSDNSSGADNQQERPALSKATMFNPRKIPPQIGYYLAGFADGSHANRVCREMTGAAPSEIARALRDSTDPSKP